MMLVTNSFGYGLFLDGPAPPQIAHRTPMVGFLFVLHSTVYHIFSIFPSYIQKDVSSRIGAQDRETPHFFSSATQTNIFFVLKIRGNTIDIYGPVW